MIKKFLTALLLLALSASSVACGGNVQESKEPSKSSEVVSNAPSDESKVTPAPESQNKTENASDNDPAKVSEKTLEDVEDYLLDKGVLSGERVQMGAELIGGIAGFKYKDSAAEIYEYDMGSEEYKKLANGEEIPLKGMESYTVKAVSINGKFVLFGDNVSQELIDTFNSFK